VTTPSLGPTGSPLKSPYLSPGPGRGSALSILWRRAISTSSVAWAWALLIPSLLLVLGIIVYPLVTGVNLSLHRVILTRLDLGRPFVGFDNFLRMLSDPVMGFAWLNTLFYAVVGVGSQFVVGLIAALLLNRSSTRMWIPRTILMLPWFLPPIAAAYMFAFMIDPRYGIITRVLGVVGIDIGGQGVLANPTCAIWGALAVELWRGYPFFALFLLAGLQAIPTDLGEAAAIDGANRRQYFWHVVWPLLRPIVIVSTLLDGIRLATSPVMLLLLTNGGPGNSTQVVSLYAFQQAYQRFDFGYASAISVALLVAITGFAMVYVRINSGRGK